MARFEIDGKEYELKLTFESVKHLNGQFDGGSMELIGRAMMGDLDTFIKIVHAALFHAGQNFSFAVVEKEIEKAFAEEKLDMDYVLKVSNEVVVESFFYKTTAAKLLKSDPKAAEQFKMLMN
ncbi:tail assembly chaperone [Neobacillus sp. NPDC093127]|uniref:tail assembly chaperone n=1 Tax=Neobacillus sp. NPDC093127 TaxID=3364296 RepID=UPI0038302B32